MKKGNKKNSGKLVDYKDLERNVLLEVSEELKPKPKKKKP